MTPRRNVDVPGAYRRLVLLATVLALQGGGANVAADGDWRLVVEANQHKAKASGWDGRPDVTPFATIPFTGLAVGGSIAPDSPPDLVASVLTSDGYADLRPVGICEDRYRCEFGGLPSGEEAFGLAIIDRDLTDDDFVDAVVLVNDGAHPSRSALAALASRLRRELEAHMQHNPWLEAGEERGNPYPDPVPIKVLQRCTEADPCRLGQSDVWIVSGTQRAQSSQDYVP